MNEQEKQYYELLKRFAAALDQLDEVLDAHEDCPGCALCRDCRGMWYTLDIYLDSLQSDAPSVATAKLKAERSSAGLPDR